MKTKYKIIIEVDADYPTDKLSEEMNNQLDQYIKGWIEHEGIMPALYEPTRGYSLERIPSGKVKVNIVRDKETILDTWWDELSDDF